MDFSKFADFRIHYLQKNSRCGSGCCNSIMSKSLPFLVLGWFNLNASARICVIGISV